MAVFATDSQRVSNLVKHEYEPSLDYCRKVLTFTGTTAFGLGTVLGKVTSTGAYVEAVETANDGSKAPAAVVLEDKVVNAGAIVAVAIDAAGATYTNGTYNAVITGDGEGAKVSVVVASGKVDSITVVEQGTGYTSATLALPTGAGAGDGNAAISATVGTVRKAIALVRGPVILSEAGLKLNASYNTAAKKATALDALEAKGILVIKAV